MELYADHSRVAALESQIPTLTGDARVPALVELAWHLRERDTRRARSLVHEASTLLAGHGGIADAATLAARIVLTQAECARLFGEVQEAESAAARAFEAFECARDRHGCEDVRFLLARLGRGDLDERALRSRGGPAVSARYATYVEAHAHLKAGGLEQAIECFSRVAADAPSYGMEELALESELAIARALAELGDVEGALESGGAVLDSARDRGWRPMLAAATCSVSGWLLETGDMARAAELVHEACVSLAAPSAARTDPALECRTGEVQLAAGQSSLAAATLAKAASLFRAQGLAAECARATVLEARALADLADIDSALHRATQALCAAREAKARDVELDALRTLGTLHCSHPSADRNARSAIAFLRHAAEIAEELGDIAAKAALLREMARLLEASGDAAGALATERAANARAALAWQRRANGLLAAARVRALRQRERLEVLHAQAVENAHGRHSTELRSAYDTFEQLRAMGAEILAARDNAALVATIEARLAPVLDLHFVGLFAFDAAGTRLARYAREAGRAIPLREISARDLESYAARAARERRELHIEMESAREAGASDFRDSATLWFGPVVHGDDVLGVLTVQSRRQRAYGERELLVFRSVSAYVALALAKARVHKDLEAQRAVRIETEERLHRMATVDHLTGLSTRGHFFAVARERLERARRDGGPCGLIVGDIDAFKAINDTRGHEAGDRALAAVAAIIAQHARDGDVAGRIGGEEFALLLPGASLEATVAAAETMRVAVEAMRLACDGRPVLVTMSFGCSAVADATSDIGDRPAADILERLLREADAALFEGQGTGGNRTIAWPAYQALRALRSGPSLERPPQSFA